MKVQVKNDTKSDVCDFRACNGMVLAPNITNSLTVFGQCDESFPLDEATNTYFCFVNEDSVCDKTPSDFLLPGTFISTIPCEDPNRSGLTFRFGLKKFFKKKINFFADLFGAEKPFGMCLIRGCSQTKLTDF